MQPDGVLVRFGEIGIKSAPVRRAMTERLRHNLMEAMVRRNAEGDVRAIGARLWMVGPDAVRLLDAATHTFGVVSASPTRLVPATMEAIGQAAAALALQLPTWRTFAIRATREGQHPFTSQDIGIQAGSVVYKAAEAAGRKPKVDLGKPELEVFVDVRQDRAYVFTQTLPGPGGIPTGAQGKVVALVSDHASLVAVWLMMRRGSAVVPVHAGNKPVPGIEHLVAWGLPALQPIPPGPKEALLEAAASVARSRRAIALVTGETLDSKFVPARLPILRPVCGLDPDEVLRLRATIGLDGA